MSRAYYNEIDAYAAQWLRNLISAGLIAPGDVDERSIVDVQPDDLKGYTQCHFFAGIGGWSYAARLAGWPDGRELWTGSCPCQPFSVAGKRLGFDDPRHLWPTWRRLIEECRHPVIFGEQSARAPEWLALVRSDLVQMDYAMAAVPIEAASVGSPQFRDRYWFVADADQSAIWQQPWRSGRPSGAGTEVDSGPGAGTLAGSYRGNGFWWSGPLQVGWNALAGKVEKRGRLLDAQWPIEPGLPILAHGVPARVAKLSAYGNAIVPQVAAEVIGAYLDATLPHTAHPAGGGQ